ncbi:hypothetical protein Brms1b_010533 [Colletotrichum noveboracense]|nr:hypothetical protein Brms1b_010533 [Colletotrichum noveboracense]
MWKSASKFDGSFSAVSAYLEYLLQKTSISSIQHIEDSMVNGPRDQRQLYEKYIERLSAREPSTVFWAKSTLSWILSAARTFRIEELAIAVSINLSQSTMSDIQRTVSMDMERDIRGHLSGLVSIQARHVRIASPLVAKILLSGEPSGDLQPEGQGMLAQLCLHYLKVVLGNSAPETWDKCLALASRRHRWSHVEAGDSILEFLDYTCRFWPTHFLATKNQDDALRDVVIKFFRTPEVSQKWFQLYLLFSAESNGEATTKATEGDSQFKSRLLEQYFFTDSPTKVQLSPARMAGFVGLGSIVSALLEGDMEQKGNTLELAQVRRGYLEHDIILWGDQTDIQFHCAVSRNEKSVVERLFHDDPEVFKGLFPLHKAALAGNFEIFQFLFKSYEVPSDSVLEGRTIFHAAAVSGHVRIAQLILDGETLNAPGFIDIMDNNNQTALMIAVKMGNIDLAKQLIAAGAQLAIGDRSGKTALHYSIQHCPQIVENIVSKNDSLIFFQDEVGCTSLHAAACSGSIQTTEIMLGAARGKDQLAELINTKDSQDFMALHHAAERGFDHICKVLIETGIEVDAYCGDDKTGAALLASKHGHLASLRRIFPENLEDGDRLLLEAARAGQMLVVQYLLKTGVSADGPEEAAKTPLSEAATQGHRDVVRTLLRFKADVNLQDAQRWTSLHYAAMAGMHEVAEILLNPASAATNETNIDARDFQRSTPLHIAAREGNGRMVNLLLKHHASVDARTTSEETPLHLAILVPEAVKLLLDKHAEVNAVDSLGQAPLHVATYNQCHQSAQMLLKAGADVHLADDDGAKRAVYHAIEHKDLRMVEDLYKLGDRPTEKEYLDDMAHAVKCSAADILRFLIKDCGNSIHMKKVGDDQTLLHVACETIDSPEIVSFLIESGLDVNSLGASKTPLHLAAARAKIDSMLELLKYGADINMLNQNGDAPLHLAAQNGSDTAVRMLLEKGAPVDARGFDGETPLFCAVFGGHLAASQALVESGANCNEQTDTASWSILHATSSLGSLDILKLILSREVEVNRRSTKGGWTPLSEAIYCNRLENTRLFLEAGADPNIENDESSTSLHVALENDNLEITRALLSHQGKWPVQPLIKKNGRSFIHIAAETCSKGIVQLLLESGADYTNKTTDGSSCLTLAIKGKHADNLKLFLDREAPLEPQLKWESQVIEDAYWLAVSLNQTEFVGIILDYDNSLELLNKEDKDGLDALQLALQSASPDYDFDEKPLPVDLVNRGIDPWGRKQLDRPSRFVQGLAFDDLRRKDFVEACMEVFPTDPRQAGLGFEELRAATEIDKPSLWEKLSPLLAQVGDETDQDGWNIHHFLSQSAPRTFFAGCHQESAERTTKAPTAMVRADMSIGVDYEPRVQISEDGLQVVFCKCLGASKNVILCVWTSTLIMYSRNERGELRHFVDPR